MCIQKIMKELSKVDNKLFNNKYIVNQDTSYIVGFLVILLTASILQGNLRVTIFSKNILLRIILLIIVVLIAKKNLSLGIILGFLFIILHMDTSINETFADPDGSDEDPEAKDTDDDSEATYNEDDDLDDDQKKIKNENNKENEDKEPNEDDVEEIKEVIETGDSKDTEKENDFSKKMKSTSNVPENRCLINCLQKDYKLNECKIICEDICDCGSDIKSKSVSKESYGIDEEKYRDNFKKLQEMVDNSQHVDKV